MNTINVLLLLSSSYLFIDASNPMEETTSSETVIDTQWNDLRAKFGPSLTDPNYFRPVPRTSREASQQGYVKVSDCDPRLPWLGQRYVKGDDYALTPLYDVNGIIAGIQSSVPDNLRYGFPTGKFRSVFADDGGNRLTMTVYFVPPETVCNVGRSQLSLDTEGTGTGLFIQTAWNNQTNERGFMDIPLSSEDLAGTRWVLGRCAILMGFHFFFDLSSTAECVDTFPAFLQYHQGRLVAFGFVFLTNQTTSDWFEPSSVALVDQNIATFPPCILAYNHVATLHVYLTDRFATFTCP